MLHVLHVLAVLLQACNLKRKGFCVIMETFIFLTIKLGKTDMKLYIQIGNLQLPTYGLLIVIGVIIANLIALYILKKYALDLCEFIILEAYTFLGAFLGAKLLYLWVSRENIDWSQFFDPDYFNQIMQGGFVFYGGLIGGIITALLAGKIHKIDSILYFRKFIVLIPIMHGFGRIGCHLAGCCYGKPYSGPFAVIFPEGSLAPSGISLFPVQLTEACFLFMIGALLVFLEIKKNYEYTIELYLILYSILRFVLEYFRYDDARGHFFLFSTSQWISIALISTVLIKNTLLRKQQELQKNR